MVVQELVALLGVKTDQASVEKADGALKNLTSLAKVAAGAFMALGTVKWVKSAIAQTAALADKFDKMSLRTGVAYDALQKLGYAAELSGASIDVVEKSLKILQRTQVEAAEGTKEAVDAFRALGVETKNADGTFRDSLEMLPDIAAALNGLSSDAERTAVSMVVFGRGGTAMLPMLKSGADGVSAMLRELEELGGLMDGDLRAASVQFNDDQTRIKTSIDSVKIAIAKALLPALNRMNDALIKWWKANGKIIRQHIETIFAKIGVTMGRLARLVQGVVSWFVRFAGNLNPMTKKILGVTTALLGFIKLLNMGPLGKFILLFTIFILLLEDFQVWLEGGNSAFGKLLDKFKALTGLDIGATLREAIQALNILASDPEPFDWAMYFEEIGNVVNDYLAAAGETWREVWSGIWAWYENLFVNNPIANYLGATLNFIIGWAQSAGDVIAALANFLMTVWDSPKEAFDTFCKVFDENLTIFWENIKAVFDNIFGIFKRGWDVLKEIGGAVGEFFGGGESGPVLKGAKNALTGPASLGGGLVSGGGITPASSGGTTYNAPTNVSVAITATPGMNEKRLATEASRQMGSEIDRRNRKAMQALVPQKEAV